MGMTDGDESGGSDGTVAVVADLKRTIDSGTFFFIVGGRLLAPVGGSLSHYQEPLPLQTQTFQMAVSAGISGSTVAAIAIGAVLAVMMAVGAVLLSRQRQGGARVASRWSGAVKQTDPEYELDSVSVNSEYSQYSGAQIYLRTSPSSPHSSSPSIPSYSCCC